MEKRYIGKMDYMARLALFLGVLALLLNPETLNYFIGFSSLQFRFQPSHIYDNIMHATAAFFLVLSLGARVYENFYHKEFNKKQYNKIQDNKQNSTQHGMEDIHPVQKYL